MPPDLIISKVNECFFQIQCSDLIRKQLYDYFSVFIKSALFDKKFKKKLWDGKKHFYNKKLSILPIGLHRQLNTFIKKHNYSYKVDFDKSTFSFDFPKEKIRELFDKYVKNTEIEFRDYQENAIYQSIIKRRGIILNPTASGKSLVIYLLTRYYLENDNKVLIVVPNINLVEQLYKEFYDYGWNDIEQHVSKVHGESAIDNSKKVIISTYQSLINYEEEWFESFNSVLVDETHKARSTSLEYILRNCFYAQNRIGFTGSLYKDDVDMFTIFSYLGNVIAEIKSKELQDRGILSKLLIKVFRLKYNLDDRLKVNSFRSRRKKNKYRQEYEFILNHKKRNEILKHLFENEINPSDNTLILVSQKDHLEIVKSYCQNLYGETRKIYVVTGDVDFEIRAEIRNAIEKESGVIFLATFGCLSTGWNQRRLHNLILYSSVKSCITIIQSIGRLLRLHKMKGLASVYDITDDLTWENEKNYMLKHFYERLKIYKEQEFEFSKHDFNVE